MENRAFEEMLKPAVCRIQKKTAEEMSEKAGVFYNRETSQFEIASLGKIIKVAYPSCRLSERLEEWHTLLLLHYLEMAQGVPLTGQWVSFGNLKDGLVRGTKFDHAAEIEIHKIFKGKSLEQLREICHKLGGKFVDTKADLCAEVFLFPRYPFLLKVWMEDEEFPLSGKLFVDRSADQYLSIEDGVTAGDLLLRKMQEVEC